MLFLVVGRLHMGANSRTSYTRFARVATRGDADIA